MKKIILLTVFPFYLMGNNYSLTTMEKKSLAMADEWINNNSMIKRQKDGSLSFYYGDNMPTLICRPLNATVIKLEKGEEVKGIKSGDSKRWDFDKVENAADGRTFVLVKPTKANIMTNLIIFTDKRIYNIKLISSPTKWTPSISFIYDKDISKSTLEKEEIDIKPQPKEIKIVKAKPKNKNTQKSKYIFESNGLWKPNNIYTKKGKTYINIGSENVSNIRLYVLNKNRSETIKYYYKNNKLIVNSIIQKAILVKDSFTKTIIKIRRK